MYRSVLFIIEIYVSVIVVWDLEYVTTCFRFFIVSPSVKGTQVAWWIKSHVPSSISVEDKTASYCVLALMGPKSRDVLQSITRTPLSNASFPYSTGQVMKSCDMDND